MGNESAVWFECTPCFHSNVGCFPRDDANQQWVCYVSHRELFTTSLIAIIAVIPAQWFPTTGVSSTQTTGACHLQNITSSHQPSKETVTQDSNTNNCKMINSWREMSAQKEKYKKSKSYHNLYLFLLTALWEHVVLDYKEFYTTVCMQTNFVLCAI